MRRTLILAPLLALGLTACERLGIEDPAKVAAAKEAEGKAVGAGCRHAGRSLEDCYSQNPKALKAAVFEPFAIACLMEVYFATIKDQVPDPEWDAKLADLSAKFRDLKDRALAHAHLA